MTAKVLIFDIETRPNLGYVWGVWDQNIGDKMMLQYGSVMSVACKWLGDDEIFYWDARSGDETHVIRHTVDMMDQADIVIAHNGNRFDIPWINARALDYGLSPPSPYKRIDTLLASRRMFKFPRNTLKYLCEKLGVSMKDDHKKFPGFSLWLECMNGNLEAWDEMKAYNIQDIVSLEELYVKIRPWIPNHPNMAILSESDSHACPKCGSHHVQRRGFYTTNTGKYQRYQCNDCGGWSRSRRTELDKEVSRALLTNAN